MASNLKEITDSASRFVNTSLDNMRQFIDTAADEVAKADVIGANRRIADQVIDSAKVTVTRVADSAANRDPIHAVLDLATGTLEGAKETVKVASEESQRINLVETGSKVTQEGLDLVRRQLELSYDTSRMVGQAMGGMIPFRVPSLSQMTQSSVRPAGVVTRVEIESDKAGKESNAKKASH